MIAVLAGCGAGTPTAATGSTAFPPSPSSLTPSATLASRATLTPPTGPCPNKVLGTATVPPAPAPAPLVATNWTTYANTSYHYRLEYPASWYVPDALPTTGTFDLLNFDPRTYHPGADALPPPPYSKIEILVAANAIGQTPREFQVAQLQTPGPLAIPPCSQTLTDTTTGGHPALRVVQWPISDYGGPPITYPQITYYIADGASLLLATEYYSPGGVPSPTFARMLASLICTA